VSVLAFDIGSSRIKALLAGWDGRVIEIRSAATPRQALEPGEQSYPVDAVLGSIEGLAAGLVVAHPDEPVDTIVFSCLGTAMVPLDRDGRPLGPALAPADTRPGTGPWLVDDIDMDSAELFRRTGSDPSVPSFLLHALWWQRQRPDLMARLHRFRSLRGYAMQELCGVDAEDRSWASRTMLLDLESNAWSEAILAAAGLPADVLPPLVAPEAVFPIEDNVIERLGLAPGAVAVIGAMDNCCALFGADGPDRSGLVNIVGTYEHMAGAASLDEVRRVADAAPAIIHTYLLPGQYISMTRVPIGDLLERVASGHPAGLDGILEGVSPEPRGAAIELDAAAVDRALASGRARSDVLQSLLESATAVLGRFADAWAGLGRPSDPVAVVGGGAGHEPVLRLKANLLRRSVVSLASDESAGLGALRLAAMAVRDLSAAEACELFPNQITTTLRPDPTTDES
jgi:xylulokinase